MKTLLFLSMLFSSAILGYSTDRSDSTKLIKFVVFAQEKRSFVDAAEIELIVNDQKLVNLTDEFGYAYFMVPKADLASLKVQMSGYKEFCINIELIDKAVCFIGLSKNRTEYYIL
ncbi:MAG: hypothetical protein IPH93_11780 [Saprospiraceae bacterium]|nr:hypothetical protein [Saprospiraceae bacterium]